jgi:hypothetical protein
MGRERSQHKDVRERGPAEWGFKKWRSHPKGHTPAKKRLVTLRFSK